jgi:hypothetical protein
MKHKEEERDEKFEHEETKLRHHTDTYDKVTPQPYTLN